MRDRDFRGKFVYKDALPKHTINDIRNKLLEIGILTTETKWYNNLDRIYSCRVEIEGTEIGTNGKGITPEYALSSAYGEFMERLQNQILFTKVRFNHKTISKHGFYYDPNEKIFSDNNVPPLPIAFKESKLLNEQQSLYDYYESNKIELISCTNKRITVPFYHLNSNNIEYLDLDFMWGGFGSNGMCAGNTPEEAINQGISEIFERYAARKVFYDNITPPTIPENYIQKYSPEQYDLLKFIESNCNTKIIVKDCSLNIKLPVIAIISFFYKDNTYTVRFGTDPVWQIALERCLTEMFQGREISNYRDVNEFLLCEENANLTNTREFKSIITKGDGKYPNSLFFSEYSYPFKGYENSKIIDNKDKLNYWLELIKDGNYQLFIRDTSYLNFPSYFIIIPGFSEVYDIRWLKIDKTLYWDREYVMSNLPFLSDEKLNLLAESLENYVVPTSGKSENILLSEFMSLPVSSQIPWNQITLDFLLCMIYYKIGKVKKSQEKLLKFIGFAKTINKSIDYDYHHVALQFLGLLSLYPKEKNKIEMILNSIYNNDLVKEVLSDLSDNDRIFQHLPLPNNYECNTCALCKFCNYQNVESIYLSFKDAIKNNNIEQLNLRGIFQNLNLA